MTTRESSQRVGVAGIFFRAIYDDPGATVPLRLSFPVGWSTVKSSSCVVWLSYELYVLHAYKRQLNSIAGILL